MEYPRAYVYRQVVRAKLFIDVHFADDIDLESIAGEAYYSRYHFLRLFRQMYGVTPQQYRRRVRMEHAKSLLGDGVPVTEVCIEVGFESLATFSAAFKSLTGTSPSEYARNIGNRRCSQWEQPLAFVPGCFAAAMCGRK